MNYCRSDWRLRNPALGSLARNAIEGMILEFGVSVGRSINVMAESGRLIYGFDWFKGLPHAWGEVSRGSFAGRPLVPENVVLIEGLFSDTLEDFLASHYGPVALAHMDADLYCPTLYVLNCLRRRFVEGSLVIFDEIEADLDHERAAWNRYLKESHQIWNLVGKQNSQGEIYRYTGYDN